MEWGIHRASIRVAILLTVFILAPTFRANAKPDCSPSSKERVCSWSEDCACCDSGVWKECRLPGGSCRADEDCVARFGADWGCRFNFQYGEYLCAYIPPPPPPPIAAQGTGFLPLLGQLQKYGPGSVVRYRSRWKLPADWYVKTWALRLTGGNLPSAGVAIPVFHREGYLNRTLQMAFDQGFFLDRQAREVMVTIAPMDTWNLMPGNYQFDITADGLVKQPLGSFTLRDTQCMILNGSGELRNTAITFIGDSRQYSVPGFTDAEWQTYLYSDFSAPQGIYTREYDPTIDNYRDRINIQAIRRLEELYCESGGGEGKIFDCVEGIAEQVVHGACPREDARDPSVAVVARPPDGEDDWNDGWRAHAKLNDEFPLGLNAWPHVFGVEDLRDLVFVTRNNSGGVVLHELGHSFGRLPDYYVYYDVNNPSTWCKEHPSRMCDASEPFKNLLKSHDKAGMVHFINRNSCDIRRIELSPPFPNPNGEGGGCTKAAFFVDYASPTSSSCYLSFAVVNAGSGQTVWSTTTFDPVPANPIVDGKRVPYVLGYVENPEQSAYWPPACVSDPAHCSKAPGFAGLNELLQPVASGVYILYAYANGSVTASKKFTWYNHQATRGCLPPGATENSVNGQDYSRVPVPSWEDTVKRLVISLGASKTALEHR